LCRERRSLRAVDAGDAGRMAPLAGGRPGNAATRHDVAAGRSRSDDAFRRQSGSSGRGPCNLSGWRSSGALPTSILCCRPITDPHSLSLRREDRLGDHSVDALGAVH
jgi:hypothetical protein